MSREAGSRVSAESIAARLRAAIERGEYQPGDQLPGENALMRENNVARPTARHALAILQSEGLTTTRRGVGVFVRDFAPVVRDGITRIGAHQWNAGKSAWDDDSRFLTVDVIEVDPATAPTAEVAGILNLTDGNQVATRHRRYLLEGKPVVIATSYLPATLVAGTRVLEPDTGPGGVYARLAELGHAPARFREDVIARMPTKTETQALQIHAATPVFVITRTAVTADGEPVEVNRITIDASTHVLRYEFDA